MENSIEIPFEITADSSKKIIELLYYSTILLLGIYLKNIKILILKDICTHMFTAALFTTVKQWKQLKYLSLDEWIKKIHTHTHHTHTHTHSRILLKSYHL